MNKNTRSRWFIEKELKRRGYWSRKNALKSQITEAKLKSRIVEQQQQFEQFVATSTQLAYDLKEEIQLLVQEVMDTHRHRDKMLETCKGIIMNLKGELESAQKFHIHEPLVHKLPVHEQQQEKIPVKDVGRDFMIIPIHGKQQINIFQKRLFFGLNRHKRKKI